jgi:hypothetical protein
MVWGMFMDNRRYASSIPAFVDLCGCRSDRHWNVLVSLTLLPTKLSQVS